MEKYRFVLDVTWEAEGHEDAWLKLADIFGQIASNDPKAVKPPGYAHFLLSGDPFWLTGDVDGRSMD